MNGMSPVGSPTEGEYPGPQLSTRCGLVGVEGHVLNQEIINVDLYVGSIQTQGRK